MSERLKLTDKDHDESGGGRAFLPPDHLYRGVIRALPVGFSLVDREGIIVDFNPAAEAITGYLRSEVAGGLHLELLHGSKDFHACPFFGHVFHDQEQSVDTEGTLIRKDGRPISITVTSAPLFDTSGAFIGGAEIFRDVTETKRLERERSNILSMFVHDMKNPLLVAHGFMGRLLEGKQKQDERKAQDYLRTVLDEIVRLERLVSDFLDFSSIQGREVLTLSSFDLNEVVRKQVGRQAIAAEEKDVKIAFGHGPGSAAMIRADRSRIERVVANLLENAIIYNRPGGSVVVTVTETEKNVFIKVSDTGIGIGKDDLPHVCDVFYRADRSRQGTGLGLAVARRIAESHGGTITVDSTLGKGSTFLVTLPKG
ncbi:MAG: ATP-binding protein [Syntrophorhabdales bacterium]|jgi:two-component system phosphate regulon sensor histidine kinase PhoR